MRKSTIWLAGLFLACVIVLGWKEQLIGSSVKENLSHWMADKSLEGVQIFLKWRSPGVALAEQAEEEARLLEAEQQAYVLKQENDTWKQQNTAEIEKINSKKNDKISDTAVRKEASQIEGSGAGTDQSENDKSGTAQNEGDKNEAARKEAVQNEAAQNGTAQNGTARNETVQNDTTQNETSKNETPQNEAAQKEGGEMEGNQNGKEGTASRGDTTKKQNGMEMDSFSEYVQAAAAGNLLNYSWKQLTDFDFLTEHFYQIHGNTTIYPSQLDGEAYLKKDFSIKRETDGPQILIYHTHGSEDFQDSKAGDPDTLITGVGDALATILEEDYGYQVYHDTTVFPYNSSYSRGREKVQKLMEQYPDIQVVIDLHRDSSPNRHLVTKIDGKSTAQIMFFNGMSQTTDGPLTTRKNENLADNLAFSLQLKLTAEQLYPGFARKNYLKAYRYNMDLAKRYALIEVGAETNTLQEEINAMEPLAKILHCVIQ